MRMDDFILLALLYSEEKMIAGRTLLQKTLYFLNEKTDLGFGFTPYFYGPYCSELSETAESLKSNGILTEKVEEFPVFNKSITYEPKKYTYKLTEIGKEIAEHVKEKYPEEAEKIKKELLLMKKLGASHNYKNLSIAAKMYHILKIEGKSMTTTEIMEEARFLNWEIRETEAKEAVKFLKGMEITS